MTGILVQVGLIVLAVLFGALFTEPVSNLRKSLWKKWKDRKEQRKLFAEAFERFVTDMEALWNSRMAISNEPISRRIQRFHSSLSEAKSHIKKPVHDVALETINEAIELCKQRKIDVDYLKDQYEKAMKKKHPSEVTQ